MTTIAATYACVTDAHATRQKLLQGGIAPSHITIADRSSSTPSNLKRALARSGVSEAVAANYARAVANGAVLVIATINALEDRDAAELAMAGLALCPDLIGEMLESTTSAAKLAELRARAAPSSAAARTLTGHGVRL